MVRLIERRERVVMAEFEPAWIGNHLNQPTLLVHDRGDRTAPLAGSEALARVLPRSRLRTTDGLGHRRVLDDVAVLAEVTAHLAGVEPAGANEARREG
jgi:pimeloyl-ACP methyl ester carboxylesterase